VLYVQVLLKDLVNPASVAIISWVAAIAVQLQMFYKEQLAKLVAAQDFIA
jgi:hypothetical protein